MKKRNIIYAVDGMIEYQALIKVGSAKVKISFANGYSNEKGRTPATFSTKNPIIQLAIENSKEFKSGHIYKMHETKTEEEVYIESEHVALQEDETVDTSNEAGNNEELTGEKQGTDTPEKKEQEQSAEETPVIQPEEETVNTSTRKEFTCNDDAKDFLEAEFGVKRSTLRTRADITACGKSNGIDVVFTD